MRSFGINNETGKVQNNVKDFQEGTKTKSSDNTRPHKKRARERERERATRQSSGNAHCNRNNVQKLAASITVIFRAQATNTRTGTI